MRGELDDDVVYVLGIVHAQGDVHETHDAVKHVLGELRGAQDRAAPDGVQATGGVGVFEGAEEGHDEGGVEWIAGAEDAEMLDWIVGCRWRVVGIGAGVGE